MNNQFPFLLNYPETGPATPLANRPIPPAAIVSGDAAFGLAVAPHSSPVRFPFLLGQHAGGEVICDFGAEIVGRLCLEVEAPAAAVLQVDYGEYYDEARLRHPSPLSWYHDQRDTFTLPPGTGEYRSAARRAFRYVRLTLPPPADAVRIRGMTCETVGYPVELRGRFSCSDDRLNRIWGICERTTRLCMQSFYEDGIKRDGLLWIGDYRVEYLCNAMLYGDARLARKCLMMMAASQRADGAMPACAALGGGHQHPRGIDCMPGIPEGVQGWVLENYNADFLGAVNEYVAYSGDTAIVSELRDCLRRLFRHLCEDVGAPGDLTPGNAFITDNGHSSGPSGFFSPAALTATLAEGVANGILLAERLGDQPWRERLQWRHDELAASMRRLYWDQDGGMFRDEAPGAASPTVSWHANAGAVIAGFLDRAAGRQSLEKLAATTGAVRPMAGFAIFHVLRGLFAAGLGAQALDWIRHDWGRVLDTGLSTCPENITADLRELFHHEETRGRGGQNDQRIPSMCHGWSAGPAFLLPSQVLGVRPLTPGFGRVAIAPDLFGLTHAGGTIPTPHGLIQIELERTDACVQARIGLPKGIEGEITVAGNHAKQLFRGRVELKLPDAGTASLP